MAIFNNVRPVRRESRVSEFAIRHDRRARSVKIFPPRFLTRTACTRSTYSCTPAAFLSYRAFSFTRHSPLRLLILIAPPRLLFFCSSLQSILFLATTRRDINIFPIDRVSCLLYELSRDFRRASRSGSKFELIS